MLDIYIYIFYSLERFQYSLANIHIMLYRKMKKVCYRWLSFPGQWPLLTMLLKDNLMNVLIYKNTSTTEHGTVALHWSTPFISEYLWNFLHWKDKLKKANRRDVTTHYGNLLSSRLVSQNNWNRTGLFISSKRLFCTIILP